MFKSMSIVTKVSDLKIIKCTLKTSLLMSVCIAFSNYSIAATVYNYGENLTPLAQAYQRGDVHILQIGDSHTAGDYFTEQLRKRLQSEIGDGGLGFAYSSKLKGQRNARHDYNSNWNTSNSRSNQWGGAYPLGGVYASPSNRYNRLTLTSQYYAGDTQNADIVVNGNAGQSLTLSNKNGNQDVRLRQSGWQTVPASISFPTSIQADANIKIGGFWLKRGRGGLVSAMGINGATQDYWNRWQTDLALGLSFSRANLVILAYGTNEAYRNKYNDVQKLSQDMRNAISLVRQGLPNATILVIGAPESLKNTSGNCGRRANYLNFVQSQLQDVAKQKGTLYWNWQDAMGGACSMKRWVNKGLAAHDGVHFSRAGYTHSANDLYDGLKNLLGNNGYQSHSHYKQPPNSSIKRHNNTYKSKNAYSNYSSGGLSKGKNNYKSSNHSNSSYSNVSKGKICDKNGRCVNF